jgi:RecA/RadA recombinase
MAINEAKEEYEKSLLELEKEEGVDEQDVDKYSEQIEVIEKKRRGRKPSKPEKIDKIASQLPKGLNIKDALSKFTKENKLSRVMKDDLCEKLIDMGHIGINYLVSDRFFGPDAGAPRSSLWETFGPSGAMKSAKGYITGGMIQKSGGVFAVIDAEGARNSRLMDLCGVDKDECVNLVPEDKDGDPCYAISACFAKARRFINFLRQELGHDFPIFILFDSIAASPSMDEWIQLKSGKEVKEDQGRRAKQISQFQRAFGGYLRNGDNTMEIINQLRAVMPKPGQFFGPSEITTSGKSTEYYSDLRLDIRKGKQITEGMFKKKSDSDSDSEGDDWKAKKVGAFFNITCKKSRQVAPERRLSDLEFYYSHGIAPFSGLFNILKADEVIVPINTRTYAWSDPRSRISGGGATPMADTPTFSRKDFDRGDWIIDNAKLFGTNKDTILKFIEDSRRVVFDPILGERIFDPHSYSMNIKNYIDGMPDKVFEGSDQEDDEGDDEDGFKRKSKVDELIESSGGAYKRSVDNAKVLEDEIP